MAIPLKYGLRSLLVRRISTAMTAGGVALVVAVFVIVMAMVSGLGSAIRETGEPDNLVVLRKGATTETSSNITMAQYDALRFLPQIRREPDGTPLVSPELPVQVLIDRVGAGQDNITLRGVLPIALRVHDKVHIIAGRMFRAAVHEVIVGKGLVGRYKNMRLGATLKFGRGSWKVVGIFAAGGSSFESEVWADVHNVQDDAQRGAYFAGVSLKLAPGADRAALIRRITSDPRINLQAESETAYYREQSAVARRLRVLGMMVAVIMGLGAVFAGTNTMYAAVSARTREIGTLRALGFSPAAVMASFVAESEILALAAGAAGVAMALPINGLSATLGSFMTSSPLAFNFRVTAAIVAQAMVFAALIGAVGGWFPARQAMRLRITDALKRL